MAVSGKTQLPEIAELWSGINLPAGCTRGVSGSAVTSALGAYAPPSPQRARPDDRQGYGRAGIRRVDLHLAHVALHLQAGEPFDITRQIDSSAHAALPGTGGISSGAAVAREGRGHRDGSWRRNNRVLWRNHFVLATKHRSNGSLVDIPQGIGDRHADRICIARPRVAAL